jgi:hypothetical protein
MLASFRVVSFRAAVVAILVVSVAIAAVLVEGCHCNRHVPGMPLARIVELAQQEGLTAVPSPAKGPRGWWITMEEKDVAVLKAIDQRASISSASFLSSTMTFTLILFCSSTRSLWMSASVLPASNVPRRPRIWPSMGSRSPLTVACFVTYSPNPAL